MLVSDFMDQLSITSLCNLMGISDNNGIKDTAKDKILYFINAGLNDIYGMFPLDFKSVTIYCTEGKTLYELDSSHNMTDEQYEENEPTSNNYLYQDAENPFSDDLLLIEGVSDVNGCFFPLNMDVCNSVFTPSYNTLQIPFMPLGKVVTVTYRCKHKPIGITDNIDLPDNLIDCLNSYVAYRVLSTLHTQESITNSQKMKQEYDEKMNNLMINGVYNTTYFTNNHKFELRGLA